MRYWPFLILLVLVAACDDIDNAQQDIDVAQERVENITASLEKAQADAQDALSKLQTQSTELQSCLQKVGKQDNQTKALIDSLGNELSEANALLKACEGNDDVIADAARRLCCMQRVENSAIDSFSIEGDRIVCKTDGETEIEC